MPRSWRREWTLTPVLVSSPLYGNVLSEGTRGGHLASQPRCSTLDASRRAVGGRACLPRSARRQRAHTGVMENLSSGSSTPRRIAIIDIPASRRSIRWLPTPAQDRSRARLMAPTASSGIRPQSRRRSCTSALTCKMRTSDAGRPLLGASSLNRRCRRIDSRARRPELLQTDDRLIDNGADFDSQEGRHPAVSIQVICTTIGMALQDDLTAKIVATRAKGGHRHLPLGSSIRLSAPCGEHRGDGQGARREYCSGRYAAGGTHHARRARLSLSASGPRSTASTGCGMNRCRKDGGGRREADSLRLPPPMTSCACVSGSRLGSGLRFQPCRPDEARDGRQRAGRNTGLRPGGT